jgi:hypothetical protein
MRERERERERDMDLMIVNGLDVIERKRRTLNW